MSGSQADSLVGGGVALATIGGVLMGVGAAEVAGKHQMIWQNSWFLTGCGLIGVGIAMVVGALAGRLRRWRVRESRNKRHDGSKSSVGESEAPLRLRLADEEWILVLDTVWIFGLEICFSNLSDRPVTLIQATIAPDSGHLRRGPMASAVAAEIDKEKSKLDVKYGNIVFNSPVIIPVDSKLERYIITSSYVPIPDGGRPKCTVIARDSLDNIYELEVPARPAKIYQS